jgi:hypothetical protein
MPILFFALSVLLGIFIGVKFFQHRMLKGHRKVTSGFWAFAAGFIVMCSSTILFEFVPWGRGNQPLSTLPPFDPNRALPAALIGDASTDADSPVDEVVTKDQMLKK